MDTYWQSDGQLPHLVNIQFRQKTTVSDICIYTDYKLDESYTPSRFVTYKNNFIVQVSLIGNVKRLDKSGHYLTL